MYVGLYVRAYIQFYILYIHTYIYIWMMHEAEKLRKSYMDVGHSSVSLTIARSWDFFKQNHQCHVAVIP